MRVIISLNNVALTFGRGRLAELLSLNGESAIPESPIQLDRKVKLKRRGHELRLVYAARDDIPARRDHRLIHLLASGRAAFDHLKAGKDDPTTRRHLTRLARLNFLAPDIIASILEGHQPVELTSRALLRTAELPIAWSEQRRVLGFG